jgi:hypothetical protein
MQIKSGGLPIPRMLYLHQNMRSAGEITENKINSSDITTDTLVQRPASGVKLKEQYY